MFLSTVTLDLWAPGPPYWYRQANHRDQAQADELEPELFQLTQEVFEAQSETLVSALDALQPQRPGMVDLYGIAFAPYACEDVFSREATLVSTLMVDRFDAAGRMLHLQNHAKSATQLPWATPLNLHRAILRAGSQMDPNEDILFIHLTSHGARSGTLAAEHWPLSVDGVTPEQLKGWLDEAGIRFRVISVSACYSDSRH